MATSVLCQQPLSNAINNNLSKGIFPDDSGFGVFIVNYEHLPHLFLVFLLLTLNK